METLLNMLSLPMLDLLRSRSKAEAFSLLLRKLGAFFVALGLYMSIRRKIMFLREPKWLQNADVAQASGFLPYLSGILFSYVTTGNLCRMFMSEDHPHMLRFTNGLASAFIRDFVLVKDPKIVKAVLMEKGTKKPEKSYRAFKRLTDYKGTLDFLSARSHTHPIYSSNRPEVYLALSHRTVDYFDSIFMPTVYELIARITNVENGDVAIVDEMHRVATSLITRIGFDEHSDDYDMSLFDSAIWIINDMMLRPQNSSYKILDKIPTPWNSELKRRQDMLVSTIERLIEKKRELLKNPEYKADDVISVLLKNPLNSDTDILGILSVFFFAGFDTTSNTMTMALMNLAENPDVQERCRDEIEEVIGLDSAPTIQQLQQLKCLKAVINETLRLFPTVPLMAREVTEKHKGICPRFNEADAFGIGINVFGLHYNPDGWNKPNDFVPERWLDKGFDEHLDESQRVYCPFAMGKRSCLGKQFATIEMLAVLSSIIQKFDVSESHTGEELEIKEAGTLVVNRGFHLKFSAVEEDHVSLGTDVSEDVFTRSNVAKHNKLDDIWIIIRGSVYDITQYMRREEDEHPGGVAVLLGLAGTDCTEDYEFTGHSEDADEILKEFRIGAVEAESPEPFVLEWKRSMSFGGLSESSMSIKPRRNTLNALPNAMPPQPSKGKSRSRRSTLSF